MNLEAYKLLSPHLDDEDKLDKGLPPPFLHRGWQVATGVLALIASLQFFLLLLPAFTSSAKDPYKNGFSTDFHDAKRHIQLEKGRFRSAIRAYENGTLYRVEEVGEIVYTGTSLEPEVLDSAWEQLLARRYFVLNEYEIEQLNQDTSLPALEAFTPRDGADNGAGVFGGVDVLHSLHCLDALRRVIKGRPHKMIELGADIMEMHVDHCIDQLRQTITCSGDLTPVTLRPVWSTDAHGEPVMLALGETERMHTCRNFEMIQEWVLSRTN